MLMKNGQLTGAVEDMFIGPKLFTRVLSPLLSTLSLYNAPHEYFIGIIKYTHTHTHTYIYIYKYTHTGNRILHKHK